jgi:hypothetical protein
MLQSCGKPRHLVRSDACIEQEICHSRSTFSSPCLPCDHATFDLPVALLVNLFYLSRGSNQDYSWQLPDLSVLPY